MKLTSTLFAFTVTSYAFAQSSGSGGNIGLPAGVPSCAVHLSLELLLTIAIMRNSIPYLVEPVSNFERDVPV
jgi:hypothetical protein